MIVFIDFEGFLLIDLLRNTFVWYSFFGSIIKVLDFSAEAC